MTGESQSLNRRRDLIDDVLWDSGNDDCLGFHGDDCLGLHWGDASRFRGC